MGQIYQNFQEKTFALWELAHQLKKPVRHDVCWTTGIVHGRSDYRELQIQFLALAASIIISEPAVPEIICAWDSPRPYSDLAKHRKGTGFPDVFWDCMKPAPLVSSHNRDLFQYNVAETPYVKVLRAGVSVNPWPQGLGFGYRSKWGGLRFATTPYALLSDADTICLRPCVQFFMDMAKTDPDVFCWTSHIEDDKVNIGLVLLDVPKLHTVFLPRLSRIWWTTDHKDSTFIQTVRKAFPDVADVLKLGLYSKQQANSEKYAAARKYHGKAWSDDTLHWHVWKREIARGGDKALADYGGVLDNLMASAKEQLGAEGKPKVQSDCTTAECEAAECTASAVGSVAQRSC